MTTWTGCPAAKERRFSTAISSSRCRVSRAAQLIWGVMMQFLAESRGLSAGMGSASATSTPRAASFPAARASATSCSASSWPRLLLMRMAPSFISRRVSRLMSRSVWGVMGQWRLTTSLRRSSSSRGVQGAPSVQGWGPQAMTSIPRAAAMRPTARPMRP